RLILRIAQFLLDDEAFDQRTERPFADLPALPVCSQPESFGCLQCLGPGRVLLGRADDQTLASGFPLGATFAPAINPDCGTMGPRLQSHGPILITCSPQLTLS